MPATATARQPSRRTAPGPAARRPPALRVVGRPRRTRRYLTLLGVVTAFGVFGIVSLAAFAAESAFTSRALEQEIAGLERRYSELTAEVATLESPDRVRQVAITRLGMVPAAQPAYLTVAPGETSDEAGGGTAAEGNGVPLGEAVANGLSGHVADAVKAARAGDG